MKNNINFYTYEKDLKKILSDYDIGFKKIKNKICEFMNIAGTFPISVELSLYDVK